MSLFGNSTSSGANNNATTSSASAGGGLFGSSTAPATSGSLFGSQPKDQSKSTPSFSFGNAASAGNGAAVTSSGASSGSLFGTSSTKPAEQKPLFGATGGAAPGSSTPSLGGGASGSLFGGSSLTPSSTSTSMFGSKPTATSTGTASLFGNTSSTPNSTAPSTTPTTMTSAGSLFPQTKPATNQDASTSKPGGLFGGGGASTGGSLFGGTSSNTTSAAQSTPAKPMFALNSTTPAGAPPANTSKPSSGLGLFANTSNTAPQSGLSLSNSTQQGEKKENQSFSLFQSKPATTQPTTSLWGKPATEKPMAQSEKDTAPMLGAKPATTESAGPKAGTSLFGQTKPAETAAPAKPTSLFGNAPALTPSGGSLFPSSTSTAQTPSTSALAPATSTQATSLFGNANKSTAGTTTTSEPPKSPFGIPASGAASGASKPASLFGTKPASTTAASTAPTITSAPVAGSTPTANTSAASATTAAPSTGSLFGTAAKAMPSAGSAAPKPVASQTTGLGASTSGPTSSMARLKNRTMDEILNRWATDLSKYQKEFKDQASQVAAWDRLLVENGDKIQKLYLNTFEAEKASREVERHLVTVESQQEELESWLDKYEIEVDALFSKQIGPGEQLAGPDQERERTYKLAEKITERLDEMGRDLTKMIKEINDISGTVSKGSKSDDPLSQIVRVLNGHLTQLQWIDTNAAALQAKVTAAQKASSQIGSQYGGPEQDNIDSFYRSYMGRR